MDRKHWLVAGVSIAGAVTLAVVLPPVGQIAVAGLLLLLPGYAIASALLPIHELRISELVTVILAAGAALLAVSGLLLTVLPFGVSSEAWVGLVATLVATGVVVGVLRRRPLLPSHAAGAPFGTPVLATLIALVAAGAALAVARAGTEELDRMQTFSELWAVPVQGQMLNIGLTSHEKNAKTYHIDVALDGMLIARWGGISLSPGATWETVVAAPILPEGTALQILAFIGDDKTPYRSVVLHGSTP